MIPFTHHARLLVLLVLLVLAPAAVGDTSSDGRARELAALRDRIAGLQQELEATRDAHDRRRGELRAVEKRLAALATAQRAGKRQLVESRARLATLDGERQAMRADIDRQRAALLVQVRTAYTLGRQPQLKAILNQQEPARLGRMLGYYGYLHRARTDRIATVERALAGLRAVQTRILDEETRLRALGLRQQREADAIADERAARAMVVAKLDAEIADQGRRLQRYRSDEQRLAGLLTRLRQAIDETAPEAPVTGAPFPQLRGKLAWPTKGRLLARYGQRRGSGPLNWQGLLIGAREGAAVRAVAHGRVAYADWLRGYGLLLIIDHGDGYMSLYGYNQALRRGVGDWVEAGEEIASAGSSGGQARSALYFELRHAGRPVDPAKWWRASTGAASG